uniref:Uncharacterized protein n=1 Tax=Anser brachyrhynchus TaxID=132585 RepID=A0A8B9B9Z2_9AVES
CLYSLAISSSHFLLSASVKLPVTPIVVAGLSLTIVISLSTAKASKLAFSFFFLPFRHLLSSFSSHCMVLRRVLFFSFSFSYFFFHCSAVSSTLTQTVFLMVFALHRKTDF